MKTIELTPAELELIQSKRQQEELAAQEAAVKRQRQIDQEIARLKTYYQENATKQNEQTAAAREFAKSIPGGELKTNSTKQTKVVTYGSDEVVETIPYFDIVSYIMLNGYKIDVREHIVYTKWGRGGRSQGYKMYVSGTGIDYKTSNRGYKNTKKVVELIEDTIEATKAKELHNNKQRNAVATAVANLTEQFPTAKINTGRGCKVNPYGSPSNRYTEYDEIVVVLENGIQVNYRVYSDGELTRMDLRFPNTNATELLSQLNNMNFSNEKVG